MPARFSPRVEAALRGLAGLPVRVVSGDFGKRVMVDGRMPLPVICGKMEPLSPEERRAVRASSYYPWHPLRPRLLALLRGQA